MTDFERRKYPRANYPCQITLWPEGGREETILANTSNIGIGGVCVHLNQVINAGAKVGIQLNFINPSTPFKCSGVVVRAGDKDEGFYNIGIQFESLSEIKYAFLEGKIAELISLENKGKN